jgi:hypothetical protein
MIAKQYTVMAVPGITVNGQCLLTIGEVIQVGNGPKRFRRVPKQIVSEYRDEVVREAQKLQALENELTKGI